MRPATSATARTSSPASRRARAARASRGFRSSTRSRTPSPRRSRTRRWSSSRRASLRRRDLQGRRRGDRDGDLHHRDPGARHARVGPYARRLAHRAQLPWRPLPGQGERQDHPRRDLRRGPVRPRLRSGTLIPDRARADPARHRPIHDRGHRWRPRRGSRRSSASSPTSTPTPRPRSSSWSARSAVRRRRGRRVHRRRDDEAGRRLHRRLHRAARKTMGHAGAIISGSAGTAQAKKDALEAQESRLARTRPRSPLAVEVAGAA